MEVTLFSRQLYSRKVFEKVGLKFIGNFVISNQKTEKEKAPGKFSVHRNTQKPTYSLFHKKASVSLNLLPLLLSCLFFLLMLSSARFSFSAFTFLPPLYFFAHISPLLYLLVLCVPSYWLLKSVHQSLQLLFVCLLQPMAVVLYPPFAMLDSNQGKQKRRLWKHHSSNQFDPRGCVWIVCY